MPNWEESERIVEWDQDEAGLVCFTTGNGQRWFAFPAPDNRSNNYSKLQNILRKVTPRPTKKHTRLSDLKELIQAEIARKRSKALHTKRINQAISNLQAMANLGGCSDHPEIEKMAAATADILNSILQHQGIEG